MLGELREHAPGSALSLSILLSATTIGTSAALAWLIASIVCGMTPSSAATISTTMSVTWAPRARILVNAAWPGVSMNVTLPPSTIDHVGTDVLGDAAGLAGHDVGVADLVEQRGLAVVDVTHDGDDRSARDLQRLVVVVAVVEHRLQLELFLLTGLDQQQVGADLEREQLHLLVGQRHRGGDHLAVLQQEADDVGRGAVQLRSELLRRDAALDDDGALGNRGVGCRVVGVVRRLHLVEVTTTTSTTLLARRTALAVRTRAAATGARATWATAGTAAGTTGAGTGSTEAATGTVRRTAGRGTAGPPGRGPPVPVRGPPGPPGRR